MFWRALYIAIFVVIAGFSTISAAQEQQGPGVAVLDTGTNDPNVNVVDGFNFFAGNQDLTDHTSNSHGTTVSRIVNQEAPGVAQYQLVVTDGDFTPSTSASDAAVMSAANNPDVDIIAYSSGTTFTPIPSFNTASANGKFVAIRTGNDGGPNPAPAAVAANGLPGVVIVAATEGSGVLLPNSNACGVTAGRCVGVLGNTEFNSISGTSFAAARLAGIAAAVLRNAPFLSAEELAQVIFATAIDSSDPRIGNGFVANAEQVINSPAGPSSIPDGDGGGGAGLAAAGLLVGAAVGAAVLYDDDGETLEKTLVLDSFGRPFQVDLTELASIEDGRLSISRFFDSLEQRHGSTSIRLGEHHSLEAAYVTSDLDVVDPAKYFAFEDDPAFADRNLDWVLSVSGDHPNGIHYELNKNRDPSLNFGVMDSVYGGSVGGRSNFLSGQSFAVPLLGFSAVADSMSFGFGDDHGFGLDFGVVRTDEDQRYGLESTAAVVEGSYGFNDRAEISFQLGRLEESGSLFGGSSGGTFGVDATATLAASLSGSLRIADETHLVGNYGIARSEVDQAETGLLKNFSSLRSDWFGIGLVSDEVFRKGDQLGVAFSRPLRVAEGEVDLHVPQARDFEGNIYKDESRISLEPGGNEYTLESYYLRSLGRRSSIGAYLMLRNEPNHVAGSGTDVTVLASYRARF